MADVDTGLGVITPRLNAEHWQTMGLWHPYDLPGTTHPFILSLIEPLSLFTLLIFTPSPFHLVLVTWQDLLNSVQDPFEVLTWEHYELYRHELMNIVGVHEIFFGPPSNVIIPEFFDMSVGNGE